MDWCLSRIILDLGGIVKRGVVSAPNHWWDARLDIQIGYYKRDFKDQVIPFTDIFMRYVLN